MGTMLWNDREPTLTPLQIAVTRWCCRYGRSPGEAAAAGVCSSKQIYRWGGPDVVLVWAAEFEESFPNPVAAAVRARAALTLMVPNALQVMRDALAGAELGPAQVRLAQWVVSDLMAHAKELEKEKEKEVETSGVDELVEALRLVQ
jgi:hypothetical protein